MPIVELMKSTKFQSVAERLDAIFSLFGYSKLMKTDNGPPWDRNDFEHYLKARNIMHVPSVPCGHIVMDNTSDLCKCSVKQFDIILTVKQTLEKTQYVQCY